MFQKNTIGIFVFSVPEPKTHCNWLLPINSVFFSLFFGGACTLPPYFRILPLLLDGLLAFLAKLNLAELIIYECKTVFIYLAGKVQITL